MQNNALCVTEAVSVTECYTATVTYTCENIGQCACFSPTIFGKKKIFVLGYPTLLHFRVQKNTRTEKI